MKIIDLCYQFAFWILYRLAAVWFWVFRTHLNGVFVVIWCEGRFLAVRTSYKTEWTVPGGIVANGEEWIDAAVRETAEEVGITLSIEDLHFHSVVKGDMGRNDNAQIFDCVLPALPKVTIDNREIVDSCFFTPSEAVKLRLNPHIRDYLKAHKGTAEV